ncbi:MAG: LysE family translocator [Actinomycetia bacterium]|nr:LysE family translocator [Actinomycetes bacterium]MCP4959882.1 LysE family translocator [Actinomycetes bacterium]
MPAASTLILFSGAALLLLIIPGPAVLYIVARGATQGRRAALVSVAGVHVGTLVHIAAAAAGLSAIVVASATAFSTVKLAGASYLIYLGIRALLPKPVDTEVSVDESWSTRRVFTDAVVLNVLNPKTAVFFLAFVPQFVDVSAGHTTSQLLVLGIVFIVLGLLSDGGYALAAGWVSERFGNSPELARRRDLVAGVSYISLGLITAFGGRVSSS